MTRLRKRMLEELQRRNYSPNTIRPYLYAVEDFARYFGKSPDKLGQEHLRQYQLHLVNDCKLTVETIGGRISALRFFFVKVLRRPYREIDLVYPKRPERLPVILSEEEVARLIESACSSYASYDPYWMSLATEKIPTIPQIKAPKKKEGK